MMKAGQHFLNGAAMFRKSGFETIIGSIMKVKKLNKVQEVGGIKSPVLKIQQAAEIVIMVIHAEFIGTHFHELHQLGGFPDNHGTITPGKNRSKKARNLLVLFFCEQVRDADRVSRNK